MRVCVRACVSSQQRREAHWRRGATTSSTAGKRPAQARRAGSTGASSGASTLQQQQCPFCECGVSAHAAAEAVLHVCRASSCWVERGAVSAGATRKATWQHRRAERLPFCWPVTSELACWPVDAVKRKPDRAAQEKTAEARALCFRTNRPATPIADGAQQGCSRVELVVTQWKRSSDSVGSIKRPRQQLTRPEMGTPLFAALREPALLPPRLPPVLECAMLRTSLLRTALRQCTCVQGSSQVGPERSASGPRFTARPPDSPLDSPPRPLATAGLCAASAALRSTCVAASPWCRVRLRQLARERATKRPCRLTPLATLRRNRWSWSSLSGRSSSGRRSRSLRPLHRPPARSASRRVARVLLCARHRPVRRCGRHRHSPRGLTPSTKLPAARPLVSGCPALTRLPDAPHAPYCSGCRCRGAAVVCAGAAARVLGGQIVRPALAMTVQ